MSHCWRGPDDPDPTGTQLIAVQDYLLEPGNRTIRYVWIDYACMPQRVRRSKADEGSEHTAGTEAPARTPAEEAAFKHMLRECNFLYLGTRVLLLLDRCLPLTSDL